MTMTDKQALEINVQATAAAMDAIKAQAAKGVGSAFPQKRTAAVVAYALTEVLSANPVPEGTDADEWTKLVIRAALTTGPLMQGSTLQKAAVKAGIYAAATALNDEYDV